MISIYQKLNSRQNSNRNENQQKENNIIQSKLVRIEEMEKGIMKIFPSYKLNKNSVVIYGEIANFYGLREIEEDYKTMRKILKENIIPYLKGVIYEDIEKAYFVSIFNKVAEFDILSIHRNYFIASLVRTFVGKTSYLNLAIKLERGDKMGDEKMILLSYAIVYLDSNLKQKYESDFLKLKRRIYELKAERTGTDNDVKRAIKFILEQKR
jgi:hypothetical protein